jgi:hypothetical protein
VVGVYEDDEELLELDELDELELDEECTDGVWLDPDDPPPEPERGTAWFC